MSVKMLKEMETTKYIQTPVLGFQNQKIEFISDYSEHVDQQWWRVKNTILKRTVVITVQPLVILNNQSNMPKSNDALGMRGHRSRNQSGALRGKRSDTHIGTIEQQYGIELDVRSDMHLGTYLENNNIESLNDLITGK